MIQDIFPLVMKNQYEKKVPASNDRVLSFQEDRIFVRKGERSDYLCYGELTDWCGVSGEPIPPAVYLFSLGECAYFLADLPEAFVEKAQENGFSYVRMFAMRRKKPKELVFAAATAWHLYVWYRDNRFCGRCGQRLLHSETLRMLCCPCCGNQVFPKIAPAVIVGVTNGESILLTKYADREYTRYALVAGFTEIGETAEETVRREVFEETGLLVSEPRYYGSQPADREYTRYALVAGFTEIGETAEETVRREVFEETGLLVSEPRYYGSQPWGFDLNLLLGYFCEVKDASALRLDEEELADAAWVHYSELPRDEEGLSLTQRMIGAFRDSFRK